MNTTTLIIIGIIALVAVGVGALYYNKNRNQQRLFEEAFAHIKQVPQKKRTSFLLFMFKEAMAPKKSKASSAMLNNPKYIEIQMIQMSQILKDTSKVTDKRMHGALNLLKTYQKWETEKRKKMKEAKEAAENKAA